MSSVLRSVRKRKKGHTLGAVDVIDREKYAELEVDAKVELIRSLVPLGLMHIEELLDEEVTALAGERYARKAPLVGGRRGMAATPGRVGLSRSQRVPIRVPTRIHFVCACHGELEMPLRVVRGVAWRSRRQRPVATVFFARAVAGISCRSSATRAPLRDQRGGSNIAAGRAARLRPSPGALQQPHPRPAHAVLTSGPSSITVPVLGDPSNRRGPPACIQKPSPSSD